MSAAQHTPGPWAWFGNAGSNSLYLATTHSGRRFVMDFVRWGFRGAQPRFRPGKGIMVDAKDLLQFEVGDPAVRGVDQAKADTSVYRLDVRGIDCADARLIAAAPDMWEALRLARAFIIVVRDDYGPILREKADADLAKIDAALAKAGEP